MLRQANRYVLVLLGITLSACATLDASSRDHIEPSQSEARIEIGAEQTRVAIVEEFEERGFQRVDTRIADGARFITFKGTRTTQTSGSTDSVTSTAIGSVFVARIVPVSASETRVRLFGKPTMDGKEICTEYDWEGTTCETVKTGVAWPGRELMTGREEAETIRSVLLALKDRSLNLKQQGDRPIFGQ
jgi:hypothetical protein